MSELKSFQNQQAIILEINHKTGLGFTEITDFFNEQETLTKIDLLDEWLYQLEIIFYEIIENWADSPTVH